MSRIQGIAARLRSRLFRGQSESRMEEEFGFHLEMETKRNIDAGMSPGEARRSALLVFGGEDAHRERMRDGRGLRWIDDARQDTRFALRALARRPGFAFAAILTIALGIGATSSVLSVANALLLKPLPVTSPETLVSIQERRSGSTSNGLEGERIPFSRVLGYRAGTAGVLTDVAGFQYRSFSLSADGAATAVTGGMVSSNFFMLLGVRPLLGTVLDGSRTASVVISEVLWRSHFGGSRDVVGKSILIDGQSFRIAGVAPREFRGLTPPMTQDIWVPHEAYRFGSDPSSSDRWVGVFARLSPGVSRAQAAAAVHATSIAMPQDKGTTVLGARVDQMEGLPQDMRKGLRAGMTMLFSTALLVLLIASANIAGLLLTQGVARRREIAVRLSIGAGRGRLLRQLQTEALVLFTIGGAAGIALAFWATNVYSHLSLPVPFPVDMQSTPDARVLLISLAVAGITGLIFGLTPALSSTRSPIVTELRDGGRTGSAGSNRMRSIFVTAQLTVSVLLLVLASLFVRSLQRASAADLGMDPRGVVVGALDPTSQGYDETRARLFYTEIATKLRAVPGVQNVGYADNVMISASRSGGDVTAAGDTSRNPNATFFKVDASFFETMRIRLLAGRGFDERDAAGAPPVVVINETLAGLLWPGHSAVGEEMMMGGKRFTVIGVAKDGKYYTVTEKPTPTVFFPFLQAYRNSMSLHVRSTRPAGEMLELARRTINAIDPGIALQRASSMEEVASSTLTLQRLMAFIVATFGVIGLVLAALGVYGVLAFQVAQRTREFGVRAALGARPAQMLLHVVSGGARLAIIGAVVGTVLAAGAAHAVRSFLYGVQALDPATFIVVPLLLCAVAMAASYIPARRATRVSPTEALRAD